MSTPVSETHTSFLGHPFIAYLSEKLYNVPHLSLPNLHALFLARIPPWEAEYAWGYELCFYLCGLFEALSAPKLERVVVDLRWLNGLTSGVNIREEIDWSRVRRAIRGIRRWDGPVALPHILVISSAEPRWANERNLQVDLAGLQELRESGEVQFVTKWGGELESED